MLQTNDHLFHPNQEFWIRCAAENKSHEMLVSFRDPVNETNYVLVILLILQQIFTLSMHWVIRFERESVGSSETVKVGTEDFEYNPSKRTPKYYFKE